MATAAASCTTGAVTTTNGSLFVASSSYCCAAFTSVTDSKLNVYGNAVPDKPDGAGGTIRQDYKAVGTGGASHTFTLTGASAAFYGTLSVQEVTGAATSPLDKTATGAETNTAHTTDSTATTAQAAEILIGAGGCFNPTGYTTDTGAGWVQQTNLDTDANTEGLIVGTRIVAATSTYTYTYTSGNSRACAQDISTWKELVATGTIFRNQGDMTGLGSGGKFFKGPLQ